MKAKDSPKKDELEPLLTPKISVNGEEILETKPKLKMTQHAHSIPLQIENFQNWDFGKLNMIFGTDSQPFIMFVNQKGKSVTMGVKSNMSVRNHQSVVRLDEERLIFVGGVNHLFNHVTSKCYEYNIRSSKYTKMGNLINRRFFAQVAFTKGRLLVMGGRDYGGDSIAILNSCEEYDFGLKKWVQMSNLNYARCNFTSVVFKDHIYVFSGLGKSSDLLNSIERFNFEKNEWEVLGLEISQDMLGNLSFHKGNHLLVLGGTRAWGPGSFVKLNMKYGADLGEANLKRIQNKNALSKPVVTEKEVLVFGGFFSNVIVLDRKSLSIVDDSKVTSRYSQVISQIDRLCLQSFRLTKCSFVLPVENSGGQL